MLRKKKRPPLLLVLLVIGALCALYVSGTLDPLLEQGAPSAEQAQGWAGKLKEGFGAARGWAGGAAQSARGWLAGLAEKWNMEIPFLKEDGGGADLTVYFFSVGKADAILLVGGDFAMLVDAGEEDTAQALVSAISALGVTDLDLIVATHPDKDHIGGMAEVIEAFDPPVCYLSRAQKDSDEFENLTAALKDNGVSSVYPKPGDTLSFAGAHIAFLGPLDDYEEVNDCSLVFRLDFEGVSFLFPGDSGADAQKDMIGAGENLDADILKAPHHGYGAANKKDFLAAVSPSLAVITQSDIDNADEGTLERLKELGAQVYSTDAGTVVVSVKDGEVSVRQE